MANRRLQRELEERYNPVPHTAEDSVRMLANPAVRAAYDALEEEYAALNALLTARKGAGLTQDEVAHRMGTTASAVSRLEGSFRSDRHSPSFATLRKYAAACGKRLIISMV
jgi:DNA-binding XRE family transcriptional regulator